MESIKETTKKLFEINYETDFDDEKVYEQYVNEADDLIENKGWPNVYASWYEYLLNNCETEEAILNFANLFWCYEGYKYPIPNAVEFCAFFYANISLEHHPEAISVLDGIAWNALINSGIYNESDHYFENFEPLSDQNIVSAIKKWKEKK